MKKNEKICVMYLGKDPAALKNLDGSLAELDVQYSILAIPPFAIFSGLDAAPDWLPQILFVDARLNRCIDHIQLVRSNAKYNSVTIVVFNTQSAHTLDEELFAAGANICIGRQFTMRHLEKMLKKLVTLNFLYYGGNMNRDTFFVAI